MTGAAQPPIFPPGYPRGPRLRPLYHGAMWDVRPGKRGADAAGLRRRLTRDDPLLFAMRYLPHLLSDGHGQISFTQMHLDIAEHGKRFWMVQAAARSAWVSHRDAGKSVWWFVIMPIWALAHGHRSFFLCMSCTQDQAVGVHLRNLKTELERGGDLWVDFPHLRPDRPWIKSDITTAGGQRVIAGGMDKTILGLRQGADRPNGFIGDDLEVGPGQWTAASKAKTLGQLQHDILPALDPDAVAVLVGTPTGVGSLMHDAVRAARGRAGALTDQGAWLRAAGFVPRVYPAILDPGTDRERSAWETRWPIARLRRERDGDPDTDDPGDRRVFALQRMCDPDDPAATKWWTDGEYPAGSFRYAPAFGGYGLYRILSVDPAVTSKKTSDETAVVALSVTGSTPASMRVCVERAVSGQWSPDEVGEEVWGLQQEFADTVRLWLVDVGNGGDWIMSRLPTPPAGVEVQQYVTSQDSKSARAESLFDDYARGAVLHRGRFPKMEAEMVAWRWGQSKSPNLIDACGAAVRRALYGDPTRAPARRVS